MGFRLPSPLSAAAMSLAAAAAPVFAQTVPDPAGAGVPATETAGIPAGPGYAGTVDLMLRAPLAIDATVRSVARIRPEEAPGLAAGHARFYVQADISALIRGREAMPPRVGYLVDLPVDFRGRPPRLKKARVLLFARTVPGWPGELQLAGADAQQPWSPALEAQVRRIATELVAPDAPPAITGIGNAFHVAGSLPGEGETQIFLTTADGRPVSLTILRRPGEERRWAVALAEIVDEAAGPPQRDTLLWYRLACGLPEALPESSLSSMSSGDAGAAREDYQFVRDALGPCGTPAVGTVNGASG